MNNARLKMGLSVLSLPIILLKMTQNRDGHHSDSTLFPNPFPLTDCSNLSVHKWIQ